MENPNPNSNPIPAKPVLTAEQILTKHMSIRNGKKENQTERKHTPVAARLRIIFKQIRTANKEMKALVKGLGSVVEVSEKSLIEELALIVSRKLWKGDVVVPKEHRAYAMQVGLTLVNDVDRGKRKLSDSESDSDFADRDHPKRRYR